MTSTRVEHDSIAPSYYVGIDTVHGHIPYYNVTAFRNTNCVSSWEAHANIEQRRTVGCPPPVESGANWSLISGPPAYCRIQWNKVFGGCCSIQKGNPVDVMTLAKVETATDYAGRGQFPLRFVRTYNSRTAYEQYVGSSDEDLYTPIGIGWTATYFQKLRYWTSGTRAGAYVYRPDGRRLIFNEDAGVFVGLADGNDKLTKFVDGSGQITGWEYLTPNEETESYDADGKLLSIRDRAGRTQTLTYSGSRYPDSVTDHNGNTLTFVYDNIKLKHLIGLTLPGGAQVGFAYDTRKNLSIVTNADSTTRTYLYELTTSSQGKNLLTGITDEAGERYATWTYVTGTVSSSEHAGGVEHYSFSYSSGNRTVVDPLNQSRTYTTAAVHGKRRPTASTLATYGTGESKSISYDVQGNSLATKDFNNIEVHYTQDLTRNLEIDRTEAYGTPKARTISTTWNSTFRLPATITEPNRRTTFTRDGNGNVLSRTVTDTSAWPNVSRTWSYTYDTDGRVLTENGPRTDVSDVTTYTYYTCTTGAECGQLNTIANALGHVVTYNSYNAHGQPTQITDANGLVKGLAYDPRQRLTDRCVGAVLPACSGGELTHIDYLPTGLVEKVTNQDGSFIENHYDPAHRLIEIEDGAGNKVVYTLDNMGNRIGEDTYDPGMSLRRTHSRIYNSLNQLWKDVNAAGTASVTTAFGYDNNGNQTSANAPLARNSTSLYDELNRLKQITDPASGITQFGYDANDNLTSVTDPRSLVTSYTYSGFKELKTQTSPDTGLTTNTYDSGGNLSTSTDARSAVTTYGYDELNRVTSASFALGGVTDQTITYAYDTGTNQNGRLISAADATNTLAWTYDTHGRVAGKGQSVGSITLGIGYGYNGAGQQTNTVLPSGNTVVFGYNTNNQVTSLTLNGSTTILNGITYDPFGPITGWTWGNGTTATRDFDSDGKITQIDNASGASLKDYSYDDAFRITGITDAGSSAFSWTYGYDNLDRLNSATNTAVTQGWTYDANGNRLTESGTAPSTYANSSTSNRVNSISGSLPRTYDYDAVGNTLSYGTASFTYNNRGRMATATNAGTTATYTYNALGQRVRRATSIVTTLYVYDEVGHLVGEYTASGALIQETVWLGDTPVATLRPDGSGGVILYYVHADHLNTPRLVTDASNSIRWRWDSDAFGSTAPNQNPSSLGIFEYNLRFPGQQYDPMMGLHYNYFRDYDPAIGRYVESDPIGLNGGLNTYVYVESDPVEFYDSTGEQLVIPGSRPWFPGVPGVGGGLTDPQTMGKKRDERLYEQALDETGLDRSDLGRPFGRGREYCVVKCGSVEIVGRGKGKGVTQGSVTCGMSIFGFGLGCDPSEAWNNALDAANFNSPRGCQKRHCHGIAGSCKNWEGSRRG